MSWPSISCGGASAFSWPAPRAAFGDQSEKVFIHFFQRLPVLWARHSGPDNPQPGGNIFENVQQRSPDPFHVRSKVNVEQVPDQNEQRDAAHFHEHIYCLAVFPLVDNRICGVGHQLQLGQGVFAIKGGIHLAA
jgi:hypothetical protein